MKEIKDAPIGVFDSGVGGLTVAREIMRNLPQEKIVYFGDTARVPYGSKSKETIIRYSRQIVRFLKTQEVKAIVVACNTASALALETISEETDVPMIGVVEPGAKVAVETTRNKKIGLIGTRGTVKSGLYQKVIQKEDPEIQVIGQPCPLFVPLVEEGWLKDEITLEVARRYLDPLLSQDIDTLILGCTHYPLLKPIIQNVMGPDVKLIDSGAECVRDISVLLNYFELNKSRELLEQTHRFYTTANANSFAAIAEKWLERSVNVEHVNL